LLAATRPQALRATNPATLMAASCSWLTPGQTMARSGPWVEWPRPHGIHEVFATSFVPQVESVASAAWCHWRGGTVRLSAAIDEQVVVA
jgi:hypothetical protein